MAEHFTNSIGCLQQTAPPSHFAGFERSTVSPPNAPTEGKWRTSTRHYFYSLYVVVMECVELVNWYYFPDYGLLFAQLIARSAKDIDYLIEHLPNEESSIDLQVWRPLEFPLYIPVRFFPIMMSRFLILVGSPTEVGGRELSGGKSFGADSGCRRAAFGTDPAGSQWHCADAAQSAGCRCRRTAVRAKCQRRSQPDGNHVNLYLCLVLYYL